MKPPCIKSRLPFSFFSVFLGGSLLPCRFAAYCFWGSVAGPNAALQTFSTCGHVSLNAFWRGQASHGDGPQARNLSENHGHQQRMRHPLPALPAAHLKRKRSFMHPRPCPRQCLLLWLQINAAACYKERLLKAIADLRRIQAGLLQAAAQAKGWAAALQAHAARAQPGEARHGLQSARMLHTHASMRISTRAAICASWDARISFKPVILSSLVA